MVEHDEWRIAVLIVNWNTQTLLQRCLSSLFALPEIDELEIVVVDNGSIDNSAQMVTSCFPQVNLIKNDQNEGFARANNQAYQTTSTPYVLLLNSDTEVRPGVIRACRDQLASSPGIGAIGCRIENPDRTAQNSIFRFPSLRGVLSTTLWLAQTFPSSELLNHDRYGDVTPIAETDVDVVMGSFLMVRRSDLGDELLDDGYFMYAEEADLCRRIRHLGLRVVFKPDVAVMHVRGASSRSAGQRAWSDEAKKRSQLRYLQKWNGTGVAYAANVVMLIGMVPRIAAWAGLDAIDRARGRSTGRMLKARAMQHHARCLVRPVRMGDRFHGPPTD